MSTTYKAALPMETLSFASPFPEELDSFRNVTYERRERKLEGDSANNSDNGGSNNDNAFDAFEDMQ